MNLLRSITLGIKRDFLYRRRSEKGVQSPSETLESRRGSYRDFAVILMEATRSLGLAARFVSGYIASSAGIYSFPIANASGTVGGGASHGWMQAYLPGAGWVDFDPTNSIIGNRNVIRVAVAWDPKLRRGISMRPIRPPGPTAGVDSGDVGDLAGCRVGPHVDHRAGAPAAAFPLLENPSVRQNDPAIP